MNPVVTMLRDIRLYAILKGASECMTKLEIVEGGQAQITVFLNPLGRVLSFSVADSDWQDLEAMREFIVNETGSFIATLETES